ncbi:MAG: tetraacyldisaccharide 4'-kinase [Phycisphaerales bacterium]
MSSKRSFLAPFTPLYRVAIAIRNRRFDSGRRAVTFDRPVISVGNLSTGGTGKTPFTMHLIRMLRDAGHNPCVAMRGYGAPKGKGQDSDEAREYLSAFPNLPLVAQPDRTTGLIELFARDENNTISPIILDDGFQHRQIARQLDIVLMDATRSAFEDSLLPAGNLREPVANLARAHVLVITHAKQASNIRQQALAINPNLIICECDHAWNGFVDAHNTPLEITALRNSRVFALCAIGNPHAFFEQASSVANIVGKAALRDHDPYSDATIASLAKQIEAVNADTLLVTNKDWSKLQRLQPASWPSCIKQVVRPVLTIEFRSGEAELRNIILKTASSTVE